MDRVRYESRNGVGWIDLDDGGVNVMSLEMQHEIHAALDTAEKEGVVVVIRGRPGTFSAGFDLRVLRGDDSGKSAQMVLGGFELARRVLSHPRPVLVACTGHAVAMGLFLTLAGDYRLGTTSDARLTANEVVIGLTLPHAAEVILRQRLTPAAFQRAAVLGVDFGPEETVASGIFDEVTDASAFDARVEELASALTQLDVAAQRATKERVRSELIERLSRAIEQDRTEFALRAAAS